MILNTIATDAARWAVDTDTADPARIVDYVRGRLAAPDAVAANGGRPMDHYRVNVERNTRTGTVRVGISHPTSPARFTGSARPEETR